MKIAMIAPPFLPCPPRGYGGIERIVATLVDELVEMGHDVTLFGHPGSKTRAKLVHFGLADAKTFDWHLEDVQVAQALTYPERFDIIHDHTRAGMAFFRLIDTPAVITVHGTTLYEVVRPAYEAFKDQNFVALSESQKRLGLPGLNWVATVYNGIDTDEFIPPRASGEYLLHVATLCARKGTHEAVQLARATGLPLVIAGRVDPGDRAYFQAEVEPYLDGCLIRYVGEVEGAEKVRVFQGARAFVLPLHWDEPFGLVFVEALACGVPVLTLNRGAASEIIQHEESGFIGTTWTDLIEPARRSDRFSRGTCRASVERFTIEAMARSYLQVYDAILSSRS